MLDMHRLSVFEQGELWYTPDGKYTMDDFYTGWGNIMAVSSFMVSQVRYEGELRLTLTPHPLPSSMTGCW